MSGGTGRGFGVTPVAALSVGARTAHPGRAVPRTRGWISRRCGRLRRALHGLRGRTCAWRRRRRRSAPKPSSRKATLCRSPRYRRVGGTACRPAANLSVQRRLSTSSFPVAWGTEAARRSRRRGPPGPSRRQRGHPPSPRRSRPAADVEDAASDDHIDVSFGTPSLLRPIDDVPLDRSGGRRPALGLRDGKQVAAVAATMPPSPVSIL